MISPESFCLYIRQGWNDPEGDKHFEKQRRAADEASDKQRRGFYNLMRRIGDELQASTKALSLPEPCAEVLDICMAPGGYSASALKYSPHAHVSGLSLPPSLGGHRILIPAAPKDPRVYVKYVDITMLAAEYGVTEIPESHVDFSNFSFDRPWASKLFDLVFCDGQVLRTHTRASYRERREAGRLTCSQLILTMQRIKPGGTLIVLLHKVEKWQTMSLLSLFDKISKIQLFKPAAAHRNRSSFYLIAKDVQPHQIEAVNAINEWKTAWKDATFASLVDEDNQVSLGGPKKQVQDEVLSLLASYGERLIELGEPVWRIQKDALSEAPWVKIRDARPVDVDAVRVEGSAPIDASETLKNLQIRD